MSITLTTTNIAKQYSGKTILANCSCSFDQGSVIVLMGRNGCGKSTFLRICSLLEPPDSGTVTFSENKSPLTHNLALRRRITLVLPKVGAFNTTVFKNISYGLRIRDIDQSTIEHKVRTALDFVGLTAKISQQARTLSSGETQRLGIARALVLEPEILFLDEPTASIDEENTEIIESIITTMKKEGRSTIIMTTHDRDQANRVGDVQLIMNNGSIENVTANAIDLNP